MVCMCVRVYYCIYMHNCRVTATVQTETYRVRDLKLYLSFVTGLTRDFHKNEILLHEPPVRVNLVFKRTKCRVALRECYEFDGF